MIAFLNAGVALAYIVLQLATMRPAMPAMAPVVLCLVLAVTAATVWRPRVGLMAVATALPLVGNAVLRDMTGVHSPLLLVVGGVWLGVALRQMREYGSGRRQILEGWELALIGLAACQAISGLVVVLRWADFFPLRGDHFFDVQVNTLGESGTLGMRLVAEALLVAVAGPVMCLIARPLLAEHETRASLVRVLATSISVAASVALLQAVADSPIGNTEHFHIRGQYNGTFPDPNALGSSLVVILALVGGRMLSVQDRWSRARMGLVLAGGFVLLALSGSRAGAAATALMLLLGAAAWGACEARRREWSSMRVLATLSGTIAALALIGASLAGALFLAAPDSALARRTAQTAARALTDGPWAVVLADRYPYWLQGIETAKMSSPAGVGTGAYRIELPNAMKWMPGPEYYRDNCMNYYLHLIAENGVVALLLFCLAVGPAAWAATRRLHRPDLGSADSGADWEVCGASAAVVALLLSMMVGPHLLFAETTVLFHLALALVARRSAESARQVGVWAVVVGLLVVLSSWAAVGTSLGKLSLEARRRVFGFPITGGLHLPEVDADGRMYWWATRNAYLWLEAGTPRTIEVLTMVPGTSPSRTQTVAFSSDGIEVARVVLEAAGVPSEVRLPPLGTAGGQVRVSVQSNRSFVPAELDRHSRDTRELSFRMKALD